MSRIRFYQNSSKELLISTSYMIWCEKYLANQLFVTVLNQITDFVYFTHANQQMPKQFTLQEMEELLPHLISEETMKQFGMALSGGDLQTSTPKNYSALCPVNPIYTFGMKNYAVNQK